MSEILIKSTQFFCHIRGEIINPTAESGFRKNQLIMSACPNPSCSKVEEAVWVFHLYVTRTKEMF